MTRTIEQRLTRRQAAILGCYTGYGFGPFEDILQLAEEVFGRPVWSHEFGDSALERKLHEAVKPLLLEIVATFGPIPEATEGVVTPLNT